MKRLKIFVIVCLMIIVGVSSANDFVICKSTYALCTTAKCDEVDHQTGLTTCHCEVKNGYSASQKPCYEPKKTAKGIQIDSRYYPITAYRQCSNDRFWADCLDAPCIQNTQNPKKADCRCQLAKNQGDYVVVSQNGENPGCNTGVISSATVEQVNEITDFIRQSDKLEAPKMKVIK